MSTEANKAITKRYATEPWVQGKLEIFDELCAPNFVLHGPDGNPYSLQDLKNAVITTRTALPDLQVTIHEIVAEDDLVIYRWAMTGTYQAAVNGKPFVSTGITILRFANELVVEDRFESGSPSLEQQIG
jgi:predicted ester cyclase